MNANRQSPMLFNTKLAEGVGFTQSDLKANRDGHMTREQMETVRIEGRKRIQRELWKLGIRLAIFVAYIVVAFLIKPVDVSMVILLIGGGVVGLPSLLQLIDVYDRWSELKSDLQTRDVKMVAGRVKFPNYGENSRGMIYIERLTFRSLAPEIMAVFEHGQRYRLYYAPKTHTLLSAEPIDPNEAIGSSWGHPEEHRSRVEI